MHHPSRSPLWRTAVAIGLLAVIPPPLGGQTLSNLKSRPAAELDSPIRFSSQAAEIALAGCSDLGDPCAPASCSSGCDPQAPCCGCPNCCQKKAAAKPNPCATSHKGLFYNNDFSYLCDPNYHGCCLGDALKLVPVGEDCRWGTLDVGGQLRLRYHHEIGMGQDAVLGNQRFQNTQHDFLLTRLRLYTDLKASDNVRVYVEGIFADAAEDATYVPRGIDRNHGDLLNAFVDARLLEGTTLRIGRQELLYGAQRYVSPLDWANTRRTFEGARLLHKSGDWALDGWYTNLVPVDPFNFDEANYDISFYGGWGTYSGCENHTLDFFYLGFDDESQAFSIHTTGARLLGKRENWLYEMMGAGQFGDAAGTTGTDHSAAMGTLGVGRALEDCVWKPTVWFYYDYASGNPSPTIVGDDNAHNQLFPLAHKYLGFIDAVQRSNIESPNVLITAKPCQKLNLLVWYYYFQSNGGSAVPSIGGTPPQSTSQFLGNELDLILQYNIAPRSNVLCGYSHFWPGNKIPGGREAEFFYLQWLVNF